MRVVVVPSLRPTRPSLPRHSFTSASSSTILPLRSRTYVYDWMVEAFTVVFAIDVAVGLRLLGALTLLVLGRMEATFGVESNWRSTGDERPFPEVSWYYPTLPKVSTALIDRRVWYQGILVVCRSIRGSRSSVARGPSRGFRWTSTGISCISCSFGTSPDCISDRSKAIAGWSSPQLNPDALATSASSLITRDKIDVPRLPDVSCALGRRT